jgi:hypothetical protein
MGRLVPPVAFPLFVLSLSLFLFETKGICLSQFCMNLIEFKSAKVWDKGQGVLVTQNFQSKVKNKKGIRFWEKLNWLT